MAKESENSFSESEEKKRKQELLERKAFLKKEIDRIERSYEGKPLEVAIDHSGRMNMDSFHITEEDAKKVSALQKELDEIDLELEKLGVPTVSYESYEVLITGSERIRDFYLKQIPKGRKKFEALQSSGAKPDEVEKQKTYLQDLENGLSKTEAEIEYYKEMKAKLVM